MLLLTEDGIYAARDRLGRTPVVIGRKEGSVAATLETCAFPNLDYEIERYLGPGEIVRLTPDGVEPLQPAGSRCRSARSCGSTTAIPASSYEGINVEEVRNRCGAALARRDNVEVDLVCRHPRLRHRPRHRIRQRRPACRTGARS